MYPKLASRAVVVWGLVRGVKYGGGGEGGNRSPQKITAWEATMGSFALVMYVCKQALTSFLNRFFHGCDERRKNCSLVGVNFLWRRKLATIVYSRLSDRRAGNAKQPPQALESKEGETLGTRLNAKVKKSESAREN